MAQTGRKPHDTLDIVPFGAETRRLRPPDSLGDAEKRAFIDLVTTVDARQFRASDLGLLCRWAELTVLAERAAFELAQPDGTVSPDGKLSPWFTVHASAVKALSGLALRLRLGPQSRAPRQPKTTITAVSYYDRQRLLEGRRDE
jgi:hypothetical protein